MMTDSPLISALFLIYFDIKAGYTLGWRRSLPGIELEGAVEYKSLPSGLHNVKKDLIYFIHNEFAGLSAFANVPKAEESRNARMIAVGILVPLSYGRLGRCWKHAKRLEEMAEELINDPNNTKILEDYWELQKDIQTIQTESLLELSSDTLSKSKGQPPEISKGHTRNRSISDGTTLLQYGHNLSEYHPVWSLSNLLSTFGPLIFPIYRAALLRKRILILGHAPVRETCDFVYIISVLSNIPLTVSELVSSSTPLQRLRPLFSIGVNDIPFLEDFSKAPNPTESGAEDSEICADGNGSGWVACTTDDILATKDTLYDVLITLPPRHFNEAKEKSWPYVESPRGTQVKATQRDLRRYRALVHGLSRINVEPHSPTFRMANAADDSYDTAQQATSDTFQVRKDPILDISVMESIVEPLSWSALAYAGFMWWASAGERHVTTDNEDENDSILLEGLDMTTETIRSDRSRSESSLPPVMHGLGFSAKKEMMIIAYFHRLTTLMLTTLSANVDDDVTDSDNEAETEIAPLRNEGEEDPVLFIRRADLVTMGLDEWSSNDIKFVEALAMLYLHHKSRIEGKSIDICGIKIC